jgi:hypothetical protein
MTSDAHIIAAQLKREPRSPWRVAVRCSQGYPQVVTSPLVLDDGTPFPTWAYLSCPVLVALCNAAESAGELTAWDEDIAADAELQAQMQELNERFRLARAAEEGGGDASPELVKELNDTGLIGMRDPLKAKCLHAHVAYELAGLDDVIGKEFLMSNPAPCAKSAFCQAFNS